MSSQLPPYGTFTSGFSSLAESKSSKESSLLSSVSICKPEEESKTVQRLIKKLNLEPHPEGGYYTQTYKSEMTVVPTWAN